MRAQQERSNGEGSDRTNTKDTAIMVMCNDWQLRRVWPLNSTNAAWTARCVCVCTILHGKTSAVMRAVQRTPYRTNATAYASSSTSGIVYVPWKKRRQRTERELMRQRWRRGKTKTVREISVVRSGWRFWGREINGQGHHHHHHQFILETQTVREYRTRNLS